MVGGAGPASRLSWEAAYVGTLLVMMVFGSPLSDSLASLRAAPKPAALQVAGFERISRQVPQACSRYAEKSALAVRTLSFRISSEAATAHEFADRLVAGTATGVRAFFHRTFASLSRFPQ